MLQINGCGISPIDSYAYCMAGTDAWQNTDGTTNHGCGEVLIRVGSEHADPSDASFDYVAWMHCVGGVANAAAFDNHGNLHIYYVPSLGNKLLILTGGNRPDNLTPTSAATDSSLSDLSALSLTDLSSFGTVATADVAIKEINGEVTSRVNLSIER